MTTGNGKSYKAAYNAIQHELTQARAQLFNSERELARARHEMRRLKFENARFRAKLEDGFQYVSPRHGWLNGDGDAIASFDEEGHGTIEAPETIQVTNLESEGSKEYEIP